MTNAVPASGGGRVMLRLQNALFERDRNVSPYLNRQNDRGGQKQRAYRDVGHGGNDHRELRLSRLASPGNAGEEGSEPETQLGEEQREHQNRGTSDGLDLRIDAERAHRRPGKNERDDNRVQNVRSPTEAVVAEHGAEDQLYVQHENREQAKREQGGFFLIEFGARLLLDPFLSGENSDRDGDAEKCLRQGGVCRRDGRRQIKKHGDAPENALRDHSDERGKAQNPQP